MTKNRSFGEDGRTQCLFSLLAAWAEYRSTAVYRFDEIDAPRTF